MPKNASTVNLLEHQSTRQIAVIIQVTCLALILMVAAFGNTLVCFVMWKHNITRNKTWHYLLSLSVSDLCGSLLTIPVMIAATLRESILNDHYICQFNGFCLVFFFISSLATLAVISVHKYVNISFPLHGFSASRSSIYYIAGVWLLSLLLALSPILGWSGYSHIPGRHQCVISVVTRADKAFLLTLMSTGFILPLLTMLFCYCNIYYKTKVHVRRMERSAIVRGQVISDARVFRTILILVVAFLFCWLPFFVYMCYGMSRQIAPPALASYAFLFGFTHSAVNPVVYALRHDIFLQGFRSVLCCTKFEILEVADPRQNSDTRIVNRLENSSLVVPGLVVKAAECLSNPTIMRRSEHFVNGDSIEFSRMINDVCDADSDTMLAAKETHSKCARADSARSYADPSFIPILREGYECCERHHDARDLVHNLTSQPQGTLNVSRTNERTSPYLNHYDTRL